jgi:hypothetical protein
MEYSRGYSSGYEWADLIVFFFCSSLIKLFYVKFYKI